MTGRVRIALGLFLLALALRVVGLGWVTTHVGDEAMHVPNAYNYAEHGHLGPDNWYHPPLKHLIAQAGIALLGDNPWGWRFRNALTGAGTVAVVFLLAEALLGSLPVAVTAALLLALDPLALLLSRSTFEDVPAIFFALLGLLLALRYHRRGGIGSLYATGLALGVAVALRIFLGSLLAATAAVLASDALRRRRPATLFDLAAALGLVPLGIFLAPWFPWFRRGYSLAEWLLQQRLSVGAATTVSGFAAFSLTRLAHPSRWFTGQIGLAFAYGTDGAEQFLVIANDPPIWLLVLPALIFLAVVAWRERRWELAAAPVAFAVIYIPLLLASRPIFLHCAVAVLPFAFVAVAWASHRTLGRMAPAFTVVALLWGSYLYPLVIGAPVQASAYRAVLEQVTPAGERP
jgi:dolichyl-phosphate-mannose--protein O-mannosyl transferase